MDPEVVGKLLDAAKGTESVWFAGLILVVGMVVAANKFGLLDFLTNRTAIQAETLVDRMLAALSASQAREDALVARLATAMAREDELRNEVAETRFEVVMLRQQIRMLLAWFQEVKQGRLALDSALPDLSGGGPR